MLPADYREEAARFLRLAQEATDAVRRAAYLQLVKSYTARAEMAEAVLRQRGDPRAGGGWPPTGR